MNYLSMEYAQYALEYNCSDKKEDMIDPVKKKKELTEKYLINIDNIKFSEFILPIDPDYSNINYDSLEEDFKEAQATLIEYEEDSSNILNANFNQIGIGLAFNKSKLIVVDIFIEREVIVDSCSISQEAANIITKVRMNTEEKGPFAMRLIKMAKKQKHAIAEISPQQIIKRESIF